MAATYSTNTLVYEAIQRKFRNAIVELVRQRLTTRYPTDAQQRIVAAFPSWQEIKAGAATSSTTGIVVLG
jgi:hypothetical protein